MANVLKLLRNNELFATREAALDNITSRAATLGDGELWVATYGTSPDAKSILALKRTWGLTIFDLDAINESISQYSYKYKMVQLTAAEIAALPNPTNIREAYKVVSYQGEESAQTVYRQVGDVVKVYKDGSLVEKYLGADTDTVNASTGVVTKYVYELISDPTTQITQAEYDALSAADKELYRPINTQSLNFVQQLADGTYSITKIDVSKFLSEAEFGDGLQVSPNGVVSLKVDSTQDNIVVGPNGIKLEGIPTTDDLEETEEVISAALNDLESRKADKTDLAELAEDVLGEVVAGNGINVSTKTDNAQTVSINIDSVQTDNALSVSADGLYFSKTIDCGLY